MAFPDTFRFPEDRSMTAVAKMVGNAVPPLLAEVIAQAICRGLDGALGYDQQTPLAA